MTDNTSNTHVFRGKNYLHGLQTSELQNMLKILQDTQSRMKREVLTLRAELETVTQERDELRKQVSIDPLTQVNNRLRYDLALQHEISRLPTADDLRQVTLESLGLLIVDADFFKQVNDQYGHEVGDEVLIAIANVLKSHVRTYDEVCRWGGEEFVIVMPGINKTGLEKTGEHIRAAVAGLRFHQYPDLRISVSIGGAIQFHQDEESVFQRADAVLFVAKNNGRNQVVIAESHR